MKALQFLWQAAFPLILATRFVTADVTVKEGKYEGDLYEGLSTVELENPILRVVTVPERGGRVAKVIDLKTGRDFVNMSMQPNKYNSENGIYERLNPKGGNPYRDPPGSFQMMKFDWKDEGGGRVGYSCSAAPLKVDRTLSLDKSSPRLGVQTVITNIGKEPVKTQFFPIYQFNTNRDATTLYDVVVFPDSVAPRGYLRYPEYARDFHFETHHGWMFCHDVRTRETIVVTHSPDDPIVEATYCYKVSIFSHMVILGKPKELKPGDSMKLEVDLWFLGGDKQLPAIGASAARIGEKNAANLRKALREEFERPAPSQAYFKLPKVDRREIYSKPDERPLMTLARIRSDGLYANPQREDFRQLTATRTLLQSIAELNAIKPTHVILQGAAYNSLPGEYEQLKKIVSLSKRKLTVCPGRRDNLEQFRKNFGEPFKYLKLNNVHLFLLPNWAGLDAAAKKDVLSRIQEHLAQKRESDVAVIVCDTPPTVRQPDGQKRRVAAELADFLENAPIDLYLTGNNFNFLQRDGNAAVVGCHDLSVLNAYQLIRFYKDRIEVVLQKTLGQPFSPVLEVPLGGAGSAIKPLSVPDGYEYFFVHLADTQLSDPGPNGKGVGKGLGDLDRFKQLTHESNPRRPAFLINAGDLVESADSDAQWGRYNEGVKTSDLPVYAAHGNHDGTIENFEKRTGQKALRLQRYKGDAFLFFPFDTYSRTKGAGLSQRLMQEYIALLDQASDARHLFLINHYPLGGMPGQKTDFLSFVAVHRPTLWMSGHTHRLGYQWLGRTFHAVGNSIGWTKEGPTTAYTGYFLNFVYPDRVLVVYKALYEDMFWKVEVPNPRKP